MGRAKDQLIEMLEERFNRRLASTLGISYEELNSLEFDIQEDRSDDGLLYCYRIEFRDGSDKGVLRKIEHLEDGHRVNLAPGELEDGIDDGELEWEIKSSDQLKTFKTHLESVETLLGINLDQQTEFNLLVMLHVHIIASVEQYVSSIFIHKVTNSDDLTRKLIESDPELGNKKFSLNKIYLQHEKLKVTVAGYLKSLIFHNMKKIKPMYKDVLGFEFGDIGWLFKAIEIRHDCAHRAGHDKKGNKVSLTHQGIRELITQSRELAVGIDLHINQSKT